MFAALLSSYADRDMEFTENQKWKCYKKGSDFRHFVETRYIMHGSRPGWDSEQSEHEEEDEEGDGRGRAGRLAIGRGPSGGGGHGDRVVDTAAQCDGSQG